MSESSLGCRISTDREYVALMLSVTIQHPDGVVYHFYRSDQLRRPKGQRVVFPRNNEAKAAKFISLFKATDLLKVQLLLDKKELSRLPPRKALAKAITDGRIVVYEEREKDDASDAELALLRLDIKLLLKQIVSIEKDEAAKIEKDLEDKNAVEKILIYKHEYNKGFANAAIELLTWVKDLHEVVSPTENLKRALDAGWDTYRSDSKDWQETFYTKLKATNYKEVVEALGFDPSKLTKEQIVRVFTFTQLISEDEKTQDIILEFIKEYIGAQHSLEWANFAGGAAFDIVLTALLAFFTAGVGAAAAMSAKAGRLMKPLAKLGEKLSELAKKLGKRFKPKNRKKTKVGGKSNKITGNEESKTDFIATSNGDVAEVKNLTPNKRKGKERELRVAEMTGGRSAATSRVRDSDGKLIIEDMPVKVDGEVVTGVDVIGKNGELIQVGGPGKNANDVVLEKTKKSLNALKAEANNQGVKAQVYYEQGNSDRFKQLIVESENILGKDNVFILPK